MPIYPSVITGTVAHKHESSSATGGPLDFDDITLSSLNDGSMTYVNGGGGALQELTIGAAGNRLEVSGGLPVWAADPFLTSGKLEYLGDHTNIAEETSFVFTPTNPISWADYSAIICEWGLTMPGGPTAYNLNMQLDNDSGTNYHELGFTQAATTLTPYQNISQTFFTIADTAQCAGSGTHVNGTFRINANENYPAIFSTSSSWNRSNRTFNGEKVANLGDIETLHFDSSSISGWINSRWQFYAMKR